MKSFTIKEAYSFAWSAFKAHWKFLVPLSIALGILYGLVGWGSQPDSGGWIVQLIGTLVEIYLSVGLVNIALRIVRNEVVSLNDLFLPVEIAWKYLLACLLVGLITIAGIILLVFPAFIWWVMFIFYQYLIVEKNVGPVASLRMSKKMTHGEKWHIFGFMLVVILTNIVGAIIVMVGLLVTVPLTMLAMAYVYKKLLHKLDEAPAPQPAASVQQ